MTERIPIKGDWVRQDVWNVKHWYEVSKVIGTMLWVKSSSGYEVDYPIYPLHRWKFKDEEMEKTHLPLYSEETAMAFLKEKGYTVTPPPPKLTGKVQIIKTACGSILHYPYPPIGFTIADSATILAIVDWEEGQGLESTEKATEPDGSF